MNDVDLIKEMNKILTLEHGHLGMYKDFLDFKEKPLRQTFKHFMEIEVAHISKLKEVVTNLGAKPTVLIESGDILGQLFGMTINLTSTRTLLQSYTFIEQKSHEGYSKFISKLESDDNSRNQFIAEFLASNMLEAKLMELWLNDYRKNYIH